MATMEPPNTSGQKQIFANTNEQKPKSENAKSKLNRWFLATIDPLLFIFHITLIYIAVLLADTVIITIIGWSLGGIANQIPFASLLLEGIKLLSTLGTALAYGLHLIYTLFQEGKHVVKVIRENTQETEKIV
jgi:hypothetical protein